MTYIIYVNSGRVLIDGIDISKVTLASLRSQMGIMLQDSFISRMPDDYKTEVKERGSLLSQGQKQLISFARTLLSNPSILVLDEATSSIDVQTERDLQKGLDAMLQGRTSLLKYTYIDK